MREDYQDSMMWRAGVHEEPDIDDIVRDAEEFEMSKNDPKGFYVWWERQNGTKGITDNPFPTYEDADWYRQLIYTLYGLVGFIAECK